MNKLKEKLIVMCMEKRHTCTGTYKSESPINTAKPEKEQSVKERGRHRWPSPVFASLLLRKACCESRPWCSLFILFYSRPNQMSSALTFHLSNLFTIWEIHTHTKKPKASWWIWLLRDDCAWSYDPVEKEGPMQGRNTVKHDRSAHAVYS